MDQENIDTSSPLGSAIFSDHLSSAQPEGDIIAERVRAGPRRAKEKGKQLETPRVKVDPGQIRRFRTQDFSLREVAKKTCVSHTTISDILKTSPKHGL